MLNPSTDPDFTGKVDAPDAEYPFASARDATVENDPAATPLLAKKFNDDWGFDAALVDEAAITPSGASDTALVSQRLQALHSIFDAYGTVADLAAGKFVIGKRVAITDRANGVFEVVAAGTPDGGAILDAGSGDTAVLDISGGAQFEFFGLATGNTAAVNGVAITSINSFMPAGSVLTSTGGVYAVDRQLSADGWSVDGNGAVLDATGQTNDSSEFGSGTVATVLDVKGGAYTAIAGGLSADVTEGTNAVSFSAAHGLVKDDLFIIYDDNNGSYNPARDAYKAGQYCEVAEVVSPTAVKIKSYAYQTYLSANCTTYKADLTRNFARNVGARACGVGQGNNAAVVKGVILRDLREVDCSGISAHNSNDISMFAFNCYKVTGGGLSVDQSSITSAPGIINTQYGIALTNSLFCTFEGNFTGHRHAADFSAGANFFNITNRFCKIVGTFVNLEDVGQTVTALKFHGNAESCAFEGTITGTAGVSFAGNKNRIDCTGTVDATKDGLLAHWAEITGLEFEIDGDYLVLGDPSANLDWGIVSLGEIAGFDFAIGAPSQVLSFPFKLRAPNATGQVFRIYNKAPQPFAGDWRVDFTSNVIFAPNATPAPNGSAFYDIRNEGGASAPKVKGLEQQGVYSVTTQVTNNLEQAQIDFDIGFPKVPIVVLSQIEFTTEGSGLGQDRLVSWLTNPDLDHFDVIVGTTQATNFAAALARTGTFSARLAEF